MLTDSTPDGWLALHHASRALGIPPQTVLQKVKRGELNAVLTHPDAGKACVSRCKPRNKACSKPHNPALGAV